eukprot:5503587-Amphidinium_carterae.1
MAWHSLAQLSRLFGQLVGMLVAQQRKPGRWKQSGWVTPAQNASSGCLAQRESRGSRYSPACWMRNGIVCFRKR